MSGWGCPHEVEGRCMRVKGFDCDPGMKGCVLSGRFRFSNEAKNRPPRTLRIGQTQTRIRQEGAQPQETRALGASQPQDSRRH